MAEGRRKGGRTVAQGQQTGRSRESALRLAKMLANPRRARILGELMLRPMSLTQLTEVLDADKSTVSRELRELDRWGYVEVAEERSGGRKGGPEKFYRALPENRLDHEEWGRLSRGEREEKSVNDIAFYMQRITEAIEARTFDADAELQRHFSWDVLKLDRKAWNQIGERFDETLAWLREVQAEAEERMTETGERPIPTTVGLASFRSPTEKERKALRGYRRKDARSDSS
jgi:DNA-binding transcriptional ArsR family regulator